ncbi:MAG: multicopper oxidase family protein [Holophagales bacterium]|nr:multicopper oxidase family protein [Holophagales bacterium]
MPRYIHAQVSMPKVSMPKVSRMAFLLTAAMVAEPAVAGRCPAGDSWPATFYQTVAPARAIDINPDPRIVEVDLTAAETEWPMRPGRWTSVYAYNGTIPGPTIEAEVGDRLIVNFCNDLPVETTVHWHGVETPANMDGSDIAQLVVPPGGTFRYDFPLLEAGTFWFHPHVRTNRQVERGLYGVLRVRDRAEDTALALPDRERDHILVFDDIHLDGSNQIIEPFSGDRTAVALEQLNGREGETLLLNGVHEPRLVIERRVPHRLRLLNAASSRFLRLSIPDHLMWRIGGDQGLLEKPIRVVPFVDLEKHGPTTLPRSGLLLTPGERADVLIFPRPNDDGSPLRLEWHDWQRGRHSVDFLSDETVVVAHDIPDGTLPKKTFATIQLFGASTEDFYAPPSQLVELEALSPAGAPVLPLVFGHTLPSWHTGEVTFFAQVPGKPFPVLTPEDVYTLGAGQTYIWEVRNLTGSHHNFHVHGFSFQHLETELVDLDDPSANTIIPETFLEDKDTILIVRRPGAVPGRSWSITRLITRIDDTGREGQVFAGGKVPTATTSGGWLLHCHILEHSARGMMSFFQVDDRLLVDGFESGDTRLWALVEGVAEPRDPR